MTTIRIDHCPNYNNDDGQCGRRESFYCVDGIAHVVYRAGWNFPKGGKGIFQESWAVLRLGCDCKPPQPVVLPSEVLELVERLKKGEKGGLGIERTEERRGERLWALPPW